jgi:hypothetical protein
MYSHVYNISAYQISHPSSSWPLVIVIETKTEGNFRTTDKFEVFNSIAKMNGLNIEYFSMTSYITADKKG